MKLIFVTHDIGGANLVFSYIIAQSLENYYILAEGPAKLSASGINSDQFINRETAADMIAKNEVSSIITGTSWNSSLELDFIRLAKNSGIQTISFLDHWTNYRERFLYPKPAWEKNLPDLFWAHDQNSLDLIKLYFPKVPVELKANYFLELNIAKYKKMNLEYEKNSFLFLTEPISTHYGNSLGYDEFDALDLFLSKLKVLKSSDLDFKVTIRPHPSERELATDKYKKYINESTAISNEPDIFNEIYRHEFIIGCDTIAMYYASYVGRNVFCSIPIQASICTLPIVNLKYLRDIM